MVKKCCIIGAGVAGLTAIKHCLDEGIHPTCYEKDDDIGGLWHYKDTSTADDPSLYNSCSINTSKEMTCYSDFPIPKEFPNFMHHSHFKKYLDLYTDNFKMREYIHLNTMVLRVARASDFNETGQWSVKIKNILSGQEKTEIFDFVMVCNGHLTEPNIPSFEGLEKFKGNVLHTHDYKDYRGYEDKRVLMVGLGNSAADVACELSRHAEHVYISTRRGAYCIQRAAEYGIPYDHLAITRFRQALPWSLMRPVHFHKINYRYRHRNYGLAPNFNFDSAQVTISDDLPNRILLGRASIHNNVRYFTENGVVFEDGTTVDNLDAVILGTGYNFSFPFLEDSVVKMDGHFAYLYRQVWPTDLEHNTLAVIGLVQPFGPLPPVLEIQARWASMVFAGHCKLPSNVKRLEAIENWRDFVRKKYVDSPRYSTQIYFINYIDSLATDIGCKPNKLKLFFENPKLWYRVCFCPATPPQWRLHGPGQWQGARKAIESVEEKTWYPMLTRKAGDGEYDGLYEGWILLFKRLAMFVFLYLALKTFFSNGYHTYLQNL